MSYYANIGALIYADLVIMLIFTITNAGKNLLYNIYEENGFTILSPLQYIANYLIGPLTLLIVDYVIDKFSYRVLFFVSAFNFNIFLIGGLLVTNCKLECDRAMIQSVTIITSVIAGFLQAIFYVAFVAYINFLSNDKNKKLFYGLSFTLTNIASILANILGYYVVNEMTNFNFYLMLFCSSIGVQLFFIFIKDKIEYKECKLDVINQAIQLYDQIIREKNYRKFFFGSLIFGGIMNSVLYVYMPNLILLQNYPYDQIAQYFYVAYLIAGVGQTIAGLTSAKLSEYFNEFIMLYYTLFVTIIGFICAQIGYHKLSTIITMIACFCIGYTDSALNSLNLIVITIYLARSNHAFAGYNLSQSLGNGLSSIWWTIFNPMAFEYDISYLYATCVLTIISIMYFQYSIKKKKADQIINPT